MPQFNFIQPVRLLLLVYPEEHELHELLPEVLVYFPEGQLKQEVLLEYGLYVPALQENLETPLQ